jgi:hypothetical protein
MIKHDEEFVPRHFSLTIHVMYSVHIHTTVYTTLHTVCTSYKVSKGTFLRLFGQACFKRFGKFALVEKE